MIKIKNFERTKEFLELYGECDLYKPESFQELCEISLLVKSVEEAKANAIAEFLSYCQSLNEAAGDWEDPEGELWGGNIKKWDRPTVSREPVKMDFNDIRFLNQFPPIAHAGVMGRTRYSMDPRAARYVGKGLNGAREYEETTGKLPADFSLEVRFIRTGKPSTVYDKKTLMPVPQLGAVTKRPIKNNEVNPNPPPDSFYSGEYTDPETGETVRLNRKNAIYTGFGDVINKLRTPVGAPERGLKNPSNPDYPGHYQATDPNDPTKKLFDKEGNPIMVPYRKKGQIGTGLEAPLPGVPTSFLGVRSKDQLGDVRPTFPGNPNLELPPSFQGYKPQAPVSGGRSKGTEDENADTGSGSSVFNNLFKSWQQGIHNQPNRFNQRYLRYLMHRQKQFQQGAPWEDMEGNPLQRKDTGLTLEPRPLMRHLAPEGGKRGITTTQQDDKKRIFQTAEKSPIDQEYQERQAQLLQAKIEEWDPKTIKQSIRTVQKRAKNAKNLKLLADLQDALARAPQVQARYRRLLDQLMSGYHLGPEMADLGRGKVRRATGEKNKYEIEKERVTDELGNQRLVDKKQTTEVPVRNMRFLNPEAGLGQSKYMLYNLVPAPGEPIEISKELAEEVQRAIKQGLTPQNTVLLAKKKLGDILFKRNYGRQSKAGGIRNFEIVQRGKKFYFKDSSSDKQERGLCRWAQTDENGDVLFIYRHDDSEYQMPIYSPGIKDKYVDNNKSLLGAFNSNPQGSEESIGYENQERENLSRFGKFLNKNQTPKQSVTEDEGLEMPIMRNVAQGVNIGLRRAASNWGCTESQVEDLIERKDELEQMAHEYAIKNLKNGKILDFEEGKDVYMHVPYMKEQFPHLAAAVKMMDKFLKARDPETGEKHMHELGIHKLFSDMTLTEINQFMDRMQAEMGDEKLFSLKVNYKNMHSDVMMDAINRWGKGDKHAGSGMVHLENGNRVIFDDNGDPHEVLPGGATREIDPKELYNSFFNVGIGVPQLRRMFQDARNWYIRYEAKDMVKKVIQSDYWSKKSKIEGRRGRGAAADDDYDPEANARKQNLAAEAAKKSKRGYGKFNGEMKKLQQMTRIAYHQAKVNLEAAKSRVERTKKKGKSPDQKMLADLIAAEINYDSKEIAMLAQAQLRKAALMQDMTSEQEIERYIAANIEKRIIELKEQKKADNLNTTTLTRNPELKIRDPEMILQHIEKELGGVKNSPIAIRLASDLISDDPKAMQKSYHGILQLLGAEHEDEDIDAAKGAELKELDHELSYHAIKVMQDDIRDGNMTPELMDKIKVLASNLDNLGLMTDFVMAVHQWAGGSFV